MKKPSLFLVVLLINLCAWAIPSAYAEDAPENDELSLDIQIAEKDILFNGLRTLVGNSVNLAVDGKDTPSDPDHVIAALSQTLNYSLMSFALLFMVVKMFFWLFKAETGDNDEKILDFQHAPMAVFISVLVLLPLNSGYSMLQHVVIWAGSHSISLANKQVNASAEFLDRNKGFAVPTAPMNSSQVILDAFESFVCVDTYLTKTGKHNIEINNKRETDWFGDEDYIYVSTDGVYDSFWVEDYAEIEANESFATGQTVNLPEGVCGTQSLIFGSMDDAYEKTDEVALFRESLNTLFQDTLNEPVRDLASDFVQKILVNKNYTAADEAHYVLQLELLSQEFNKEYLNHLMALVNQFDPDNVSDGSSLSNKEATRKLREYGAGYLGVYFWEYAKRNAATAQMTKVTYNAKGRVNDAWYRVIDTETSNTIDSSTNRITDQVMKNRRDNDVELPEDTGITLIAEIDTEIDEMLDTEKIPFNFLSQIFIQPIRILMDEQDPVRGMMDAGHTMIMTSEGILASTWALNKVATGTSLGRRIFGNQNDNEDDKSAESSSKSKFNLNFLEDISVALYWFAIILMIIGILFAFGLPVIPVFHWISGLIGFFIVFIQALILAPLLGIAHLLSGEKTFMNQKTNQGYMAIIQLVTYLPIMVFSFFAAYLILMIGTKLAQIIFIPFFTSIVGNSFAGIVTGLCMVILFFLLNVQIFNRCFSLITYLPEKAGKFLGGGEESLGDDVNESKGHFVAFAKGTGGKTGKLIERAAKKGSGRESGNSMKTKVNN